MTANKLPRYKFFTFDLDLLKFGEVTPSEIGINYLHGRKHYYLLKGDRRLLIARAMNIKKASAIMISLYYLYKQKSQ